MKITAPTSARSRGTSSSSSDLRSSSGNGRVAAGFKGLNEQLDRIADSEDQLDAVAKLLQRSPAPPARPKWVDRAKRRARSETR